MSLSDFALWMQQQNYLQNHTTTPNPNDNTGNNDTEVEISKLIIFLNRYSRLLIKKGLSNFPELIGEDFTYLYILMNEESLTKIQLIEKNIHEKASWLEVIKRLLKHGLIAEKGDVKDKQSKRVFLTEKGKQMLYSTVEQMSKVAALVSGRLTNDEKKQLHSILKKLEDFHNPIFLNEKSKTIDSLMHKLLD